MTWVLWALAAAVIGGCVVVAVGRGGEMAEAYDDRRDVLVPGDRALESADLRAVRFTTAFRGYRMSEVDALLARLAAEMDRPGQAAERPDTPGSDDPPPAGDVTALARRDPPSNRTDRAG
ncbi:hypothetical protein BH20ACT6_BH20ACT6_01550 [soil metagenome]